MVGCLKVNTSTYRMINAMEKRGTDVKTNAITEERLSQKPYLRGATKMPRPTQPM
jgi:hypothetical protein